MGCCKSKQALIRLLIQFLYAGILITTNMQCPAIAEPKTERYSSPDSLMMNVERTPLSIYLEF